MACHTTAKVIEWSKGNFGKELVTFQVKFPLILLPEWNTHRDLSRNTRSSRAVPVEKMIAEVRSDPFIPRYWGKNQKGMQADQELSGRALTASKLLWRMAAFTAATFASLMNRFGGHKQVINRLLGPFLHTEVVVSATELANFLHLRHHKDAEPHIQDLAIAMEAALQDFGGPINWSVLDHFDPAAAEWHLPYITREERQTLPLQDLIDMSVARCARVSYKAFDGSINREADLALVKKLIGSTPLHASPTEHQARPDTGRRRKTSKGTVIVWANSELHGNFKGFIQYRKTLQNEVVRSESGL